MTQSAVANRPAASPPGVNRCVPSERAAPQTQQFGLPLAFRVRGPGCEGRIVQIRSAKCTIGSASGCTLRLHSARVPALACWIVRGADRIAVRRLQGCASLNGGAFELAELRAGDRLGIGEVELELLAVPPSDRAPASGSSAPAFAAAGTKPSPPKGTPHEDAASIREIEARLEEALRKVAQLQQESHQGFQASILAAERAEQMREALVVAHQELENSSSELTRTQEAWNWTRAELSRTQAELARTQAELVQTQAELARTAPAAPSMHPEALAARQAELEGLAAELTQRAADLDRRAMELDSREAELAARSVALDARSAALLAKEAELDRQGAALEARRKQLDTQTAELARRAAELEQRSMELEQRAEELTARASALDVQATEATRRSTELEQRAAALARREAELEARAAELDAHLEQVQQQLTELERLRPPFEVARQPVQAAEPSASVADTPSSSATLVMPHGARSSANCEVDEDRGMRTSTPHSPDPNRLLRPPEAKLHSGEELETVLSRLVQAGLWRAEENEASARDAGCSASGPMAGSDSIPAASSGEGASAGLPLPAAHEDPAGSSDLPDRPVQRPATPAAEEDESIEAYMARLLQRVRGETAASTVQPPKEEPMAPPPSPAPPASPVDPTAKLTPQEYVPRSAAPESHTHLSTLREVANVAARLAVDRHVRKQTGKKAASKLLGGLLTSSGGVAAAYWAWRAGSLPGLVGAGIGGLTGVVWVVTSLRQLLHTLLGPRTPPAGRAPSAKA